MAKLGKEKFNRIGTVSERTTSRGTYEFYLYYDTTYSRFYFEREEIKKYFPERYTKISFEGCDTRAKAITVMKTFIGEDLPTKRFLRIKLGVGEGINIDIMNPELKEMFDRPYGKHRINIDFERILRYGSDDYCYGECDENWKPKDGYLGGREHNLIEWDERTEQFLVNMQNQLDTLCRNVVEFFNVDSVATLKQKIVSNQLLIGTSK